MSTVTDSYNRSLQFAYNSIGTLSTVITPDNTTISYGYTATNGFQLLTSVSYPTSPAQTVTYQYGQNGAPANALTAIVDENGNTFSSWTYDAYGRGLTANLGTGANAQTTAVAYNDTNGSRIVTNPFSVNDTYTFTTLQNMPKITQISRAATTTTAAATRNFTYDTNGYLATATDWNGNLTTYTNNAHGKPTKIVEPTRTTTIVYYTTPPILIHLPKTITTTGLTTTFVYDTSTGNLLTQTDKDTTTQTVPYSTNGQTRISTYTWNNFLLASVQNPRTDVTAITNFGYDSTGALTSITDALTHPTNITSHTGGGRPLTIVDPNSVTTTLTYDARQRLTSSSVSTSAGARTTTYAIDPTGVLDKLTLPDSSFLSYGYDSAHRVTQVTDSVGNYIIYTLDALGDKTQINTYNSASALKRQHAATFDALGRILTDVGGMSQTTTYSNYDNNGNAQTITDPDLNPATQVFDALNRLTQVTDANTGVTKFIYNVHDRITKVTDPNAHNTIDVYDGFGDAIQQTSPDTGVTVYYYDGDRNLTSKTDALNIVTNNTYDKLDRISTTVYPAQTALNVAYTYDQTGTGFGFGIGRLTSLTDAAGSLTRSYDERGNMLTEKRVNSGHTYTTTYAYDPASRVGSITYPDGAIVTNQYDGAGYFNQLSATPSGSSTNQTLATIGHLPFGPLNSVTFGNGVAETWTIDNDYRPTNITDTVSSTTLQNVTYGYDSANNLKTITDAINAANTQTLGYDVLNRIHTAVSGTGGYGSLSWTYDKNGNLKTAVAGGSTTTYTTATTSNLLASYKLGTVTTTVSTNANGNITSIPPVGSTTPATYAYGNDNRLYSVTGTSPAISGITYDAFGRRFSKTNSSTSILYFYAQDGSVLEENNSSVYTDYLYADRRPIADLQPGISPTADRVNYILADRLGTPQLVSNSSATTVWSTTYRPYGQGGIPISAIVNNLRLPGQNYDLETGFHYNLTRDYMSNIGRYLEADPIGVIGGLNPYRYANASPGEYRDRNGLEPLDFIHDQTGDTVLEKTLSQGLQQAGMPDKYSDPVANMCVTAYDVYKDTKVVTLLGLATSVGQALFMQKLEQNLANSKEAQRLEQSAIQQANTTSQATSSAVQNWLNSLSWNPFATFNRAVNNQ